MVAGRFSRDSVAHHGPPDLEEVVAVAHPIQDFSEVKHEWGA
jgi:hypothetical protein